MELMTVMAIIGIIAAFAYPSYTQTIVKTRRNTAKSCLAEYVHFMERFYTANLRYDKDENGNAITIPNLGCTTESQLNNYYTFSIDDLMAKTFTAKATPIGSQLRDDTKCATLSLDQSGKRMTSVSGNTAVCW
jgi:type IV pilus assembly protein PilE